MKGLTTRKNAMGFLATRLHYTADEEKDPGSTDPLIREKAQAWLDAQRALWPDPIDFEREFEISFDVGYGSRVFPQFTMETHARALKVARHKVIYRAWDFGWHAPACLVAQADGKDRLLILQEHVGSKLTTREFAEKVVAGCVKDYPQHAAGFVDFCDPAGQQVKSIESERSERRDVEILNGLGIYPGYSYGWSRKNARALVHQLLAIRNDQTPGMYIEDTHCPVLLQAFLGRYVYPVTRDGRTKEDPNDDEHPWADVMAALRYLVIGLQRKLGLQHLGQPAEALSGPAERVAYHGYGTQRRGGMYGR